MRKNKTSNTDDPRRIFFVFIFYICYLSSICWIYTVSKYHWVANSPVVVSEASMINFTNAKVKMYWKKCVTEFGK